MLFRLGLNIVKLAFSPTFIVGFVNPKTVLGALVIFTIRSFMSILPVEFAAANEVCKFSIPKAALSNSHCLFSMSSGVWSEQITSIVPSFTRLINASMSSFVRSGGVTLKEVNFKTMESKVVPNLYFTGEVMDIDGITGGYNFQAAWTTAFIAGKLN